ncbi:MAG: class I SAM-dependent methyltransferase [Erysipelotrichaceae bacterium]|nr:class I SAM-dependent methyltransferase [Erysipelotrichaceae bacterium]
MSHYFINDENMAKNRRDISFRFLGRSFQLISDDGVFSKDTLDYGTRVLMERVLKYPLGKRVLDLGCGYGPVGIFVKTFQPDCEVTMLDINERAVELAKQNVERYHFDNRVDCSDLYAAVVNEKFDEIITNPPIRAGKAVIYEIFRQAYDHLNEKGRLWVVIRKNHGAKSAIKEIETVFGNCEVIDKEKGYFILMAHR